MGASKGPQTLAVTGTERPLLSVRTSATHVSGSSSRNAPYLPRVEGLGFRVDGVRVS